MKPFTHYLLLVIDDQRTHVRVRGSQPNPSSRQFKRALKKSLVIDMIRHGFKSARSYADGGMRLLTLVLPTSGSSYEPNSSSGSATAAPLRPLGPRLTGAMRYAYGSSGASGLSRHKRRSRSNTARNFDRRYGF
jgi:hypothetical protein